MKKFLFIILLILLYPLSAMDINKPVVSFSAGITLDIAPFGIEQVYFTFQGSISSPGKIGVIFKPSFYLNSNSQIIRLPVVLNLTMNPGKGQKLAISAYAGGGLELYFDNIGSTFSPLITAGMQFFVKPFYIDIPFVTAFRPGHIDSDISIKVGLFFQF